MKLIFKKNKNYSIKNNNIIFQSNFYYNIIIQIYLLMISIDC